MCGRAYVTYTQEELDLRYLNQRRRRGPFTGLVPNFNLAPTQLTPVILLDNNEVEMKLFRWGLIPLWAKDPKDAAKYSLINAKAEGISESRSYAKPFKSQRCIVPVSGFFEWQRPESGPKTPFAIHLKTKAIMSLAGIWEHWESKTTGEIINSFSIVTCEPNDFMKPIHNRMPVILDPKDEHRWINTSYQETSSLKHILVPCPSEWMTAYEVSTLVNSPKNNTKEILLPA